MLEGGVILMYWNKAKQKFKCWLTEIKCCTEDLAVQAAYYYQGRRNGCKSGGGRRVTTGNSAGGPGACPPG